MEVDDIFRYLKPFLGEKADRMWQAYQVADFEGRNKSSSISAFSAFSIFRPLPINRPEYSFYFNCEKGQLPQPPDPRNNRPRSRPNPRPKPLIHRRVFPGCLNEADRPSKHRERR